jgi:hypothetical protein
MAFWAFPSARRKARDVPDLVSGIVVLLFAEDVSRGPPAGDEFGLRTRSYAVEPWLDDQMRKRRRP